MKPEIPNPHDRFFKQVFSEKENALDFMIHYLPPEILSLVDLDSVEIAKDSSVDEELRESFSDILYRVDLGGSPGYVYLLFEHKSFAYRFTALQLLKYMIRIWELHLKQFPKKELPVIVPLVVYHGETSWNAGLSLRDLIGTDQELLVAYVPHFDFLLYDLSEFSDDQIKGEVLLRVSLLVMKYIFRDELPGKLIEIMQLLKDLAKREKGLEYLQVGRMYELGE
jgi:predicted transposase/invertase (TIGR01784 family)